MGWCGVVCMVYGGRIKGSEWAWRTANERIGGGADHGMQALGRSEDGSRSKSRLGEDSVVVICGHFGGTTAELPSFVLAPSPQCFPYPSSLASPFTVHP